LALRSYFKGRPILAKTGVPLSYVAGEPITSKRFLISIGEKSSPKKLKKISTTIKNKESIAVAMTKVKDINLLFYQLAQRSESLP
jgi:hypothetical protein